MDQFELDAAYDRAAYAPNLQQIVKRYATNSEAVRIRIGAPRRFAYGSTPIEGLDVYLTKRANAPVNIFIHGGAWRGGLAKDFGYAAELFVNAGAHFVVPDFINVIEAGGDLMPMAVQVRRAVAWVYRNARNTCQSVRTAGPRGTAADETRSSVAPRYFARSDRSRPRSNGRHTSMVGVATPRSRANACVCPSSASTSSDLPASTS